MPEPMRASARAAWATWLAARLRDWAERLDAAAKPLPSRSRRSPLETGAPGTSVRQPPEHWRRLVAQHAPHLLDRVHPVPPDSGAAGDTRGKPGESTRAKPLPDAVDAPVPGRASGQTVGMNQATIPGNQARGARSGKGREDVAMVSMEDIDALHSHASTLYRAHSTHERRPNAVPSPPPAGMLIRSATEISTGRSEAIPQRSARTPSREDRGSTPCQLEETRSLDSGTAAAIQARTSAVPLRLFRAEASILPPVDRASSRSKSPSMSRDQPSQPPPFIDIARAAGMPIDRMPETPAFAEAPRRMHLPRTDWPVLPDRPEPVAPSSKRRTLGSAEWIARLESEQRGDPWNG